MPLHQLEASLDEATVCHWHLGCMRFFGEDNERTTELPEIGTEGASMMQNIRSLPLEVDGVSLDPGSVLWCDSALSLLTSNPVFTETLKTLRLENISTLPVNLKLPNVYDLSLCFRSTEERPLIHGLFAPLVRKFVVHYNGKVPRMVFCSQIGSEFQDFVVPSEFKVSNPDNGKWFSHYYPKNHDDTVMCSIFELVGTNSVRNADFTHDYALDGSDYLDLSFLRYNKFRTVLIGPSVPLSLVNPRHLEFIRTLRLVLGSPNETAGIVSEKGFTSLIRIFIIWVVVVGEGVDIPIIDLNYVPGKPRKLYNQTISIIVTSFHLRTSMHRFIDHLHSGLRTLIIYSSPRLLQTTADLEMVIGIEFTQWRRMSNEGMLQKLFVLWLTGIDPFEFLVPRHTARNITEQELVLAVPVFNLLSLDIQPVIVLNNLTPKGIEVRLENLHELFQKESLTGFTRSLTFN